MNSHLKKSEHSHERYRGKTQRLPRFLREYRGEVPGCPGGVGAYDQGNHMVNTMDRSVCGGDAVKCRVTVATCLRLSTNRSTWRHLTNGLVDRSSANAYKCSSHPQSLRTTSRGWRWTSSTLLRPSFWTSATNWRPDWRAAGSREAAAGARPTRQGPFCVR